MRPTPILLLMFLIVGCSPSPRKVTNSHTGDLGQFILESVAAHGGQPKVTNGLPALQGRWDVEVITGAEYLGDREQVHITVPTNQFSAVTGYLAQAFGRPYQPATLQTNGILFGFYSINDIGIALQFYCDDRQTGLILVGKLNR